MNEGLYHVIMAGGSGTRFWPASRRDAPKQFLTLAGSKPLIRQTFERCLQAGPAERIYVSAGVEHRDAVRRALPEIPDARFVGEPVARNTAPAVGISAMAIFLVDPEAVIVFCPADHLFADDQAYLDAIRTASAAAAGSDVLVTLGITPSRPETGYGYIEAGAPAGSGPVLHASRFIEKPDVDTARRLASSGRHYWNSGVFVWRASSILAAIGRHHPRLAEGLTLVRKAARAAVGEGTLRDPLGLPGVAGVAEEVFASQESISIDYAVMEKAPNVLVVPCDPGWSDVGSWDAVAGLGRGGADGNVFQGDVLGVEASALFVRGGKRLIALVGVSDLLVVDADDALLICRRGESQKVRDIVAALKAAGRVDLI